MAALTWRDVANPNFGGANDLIRTANGSTQQALAALSEGIKQFQVQQDQNIDGQVLANALRVNNASDYQKALSDGSLLAGVDPSRVSPRTLAALGSRAGDLINQAAGQQQIQSRQYAQDRTQQLDATQDAARSAVARGLGINDQAIANLSPEQQQAYVRNLLGNDATRVQIQGGNILNQGRAFNNLTGMRDDASNQTAITVADEIRRRSATADDARAELSDMTDLDPVTRSRATELLNRDFGQIYAPVGSGSAGQATTGARAQQGAPGTRTGSPYDVAYGFTPTNQPVSSMRVGDVVNLQTGLRASQGASPVGAFQINQATLKDFGPRVLGSNWEDQQLTPENQEKIAKAIFDERKGGDLTKTWASLPNAAPGAYKNYDWREMRSILAQGEVGQNLPSDPGSLRQLTGESVAEVGRRMSQNNSVGVTADIQRNLGNTDDAPTVAAKLIAEKFPGANQADVLRVVNEGMRSNPGLSAADVGSAIARSSSNASSIPFTRGFLGTTSFGNGVGVDDGILQANLESLRTGKADYMSQDNQRTRALGETVVNAQAAYDEALNNYQALKARQATQPGISTERAETRLQKVTEALQRALRAQQADPNQRPIRQ